MSYEEKLAKLLAELRKNRGQPYTVSIIDAFIEFYKPDDQPNVDAYFNLLRDANVNIDRLMAHLATEREANTRLNPELGIWQSRALKAEAELVAAESRLLSLATAADDALAFTVNKCPTLAENRLRDALDANEAAYRAKAKDEAVKGAESTGACILNCCECHKMSMFKTISDAISTGWSATNGNPWRCPKCSNLQPSEETKYPDGLRIGQGPAGTYRLSNGGLFVADVAGKRYSELFAYATDAFDLLDHINMTIETEGRHLIQKGSERHRKMKVLLKRVGLAEYEKTPPPSAPPEPAKDDTYTVSFEFGRWKVRRTGLYVVAEFGCPVDARRFAHSDEMVALLEWIVKTSFGNWNNVQREAKSLLSKVKGSTP